MIRAALFALLLPAAASAQSADALSSDIATNGLAATLAAETARPAPDPMAVGALQALRAVEATLQTRWRYGLTAGGLGLPLFRLPVAENPAPEPFPPEAITTLFSTLLADLDAARAALDAVDDDPEAHLTLDLADLWFDVDGNGTRDPGESLVDVSGELLGLPAETEPPTVRFDAADAAWLSAYTHFLSAFAELVLAINPAPQIARVRDFNAAVDALAADTSYTNALDMQFSAEIDLAAILYFSIQETPDQRRTQALRTHLLEMVADNQVFWRRVAAETDNAAEWIPNDQQSSALGLEFPDGLGTEWAGVLDDAAALLNGEKLIPHWRLREGAGINLRRLLEDPIPVDIAEWAHGIALLPYAEEGPRISGENWAAFSQLVGGDAPLFVLILD